VHRPHHLPAARRRPRVVSHAPCTGGGAGPVTPFVGAGTVLNVSTVLLGGTIGLLLGSRLPERVRLVAMDALGLGTLSIAGPVDPRRHGAGAGRGRRAGRRPRRHRLRASRRHPRGAAPGGGPARAAGPRAAAGAAAGPGRGAPARHEDQTSTGDGPRAGPHGSARFVEGFVTASLVFCVGPLTVLGSINDGLGRASTSSPSSRCWTGWPRPPSPPRWARGCC
jgi:hypothetical protein